MNGRGPATKRFACVSLLAAVCLAGIVPSIVRAAAPAEDRPEPRWAPSPAAIRAAGAIDEATLRAHTRFLADDLLGGRGPGSRGDRLARLYIQSRLEDLGLEPGAPEGGWLQTVPLLGSQARLPEVLTFRGPRASAALRRGDEYILALGISDASGPQSTVAIAEAECVFVGYGIVAPEYGWDDFKDVDLAGKVLIVMNSDPAGDPDLFAGETRLYYGRWDYKYAMAARKGAVAAFIIHTTPSAAYPWQVVRTSWGGEQFDLRGRSEPPLRVQGWLREEAARRVAALGDHDLDALRSAAERRDFRPVPLGVRLGAELSAEVRELDTANVLGILRGRDPERSKELIVITAHHDHLGTDPLGTDLEIPDGESPKAEIPDGDRAKAEIPDGESPKVEGSDIEGPDAALAAVPVDRIYNGALDNASGVAALLALAKAATRLPEPPRRSILFAAVAAEEQGLLGSAWLAEHPPVPAGYLAAVINVDGMNIFGRTRDVTLIGKGKSSLDGIVASVAAWQGRTVKPDPFPDRGSYYRSDQYSLARVGVPGVTLGTGTEFIGRPEGWGRAQIDAWIAEHYHQPSDEYRDDWNLEGAIEDIRLLFLVGLRIAEGDALPEWASGDEFEAPRQAALGQR